LQPSKLTQSATETLRQIAAREPDAANLVAAFRHLAKWRAEVIDKTMAKRSGTVVLSGPFKGMSYALQAAEGSHSARLLGVYEASLAPIIEIIIARAYPLVIDLGCAEGYYAVGLARRMPDARVLARDDSPRAQASCRDLATQNAVADRVEIGGRMEHGDFAICADQPSVIICDIEGGEAALLDPIAAPGLCHADILVECHNVIHRGLSKVLTQRFAATHIVTRFDRMIDGTTLPAWMEELSDLDRLIALWEWRSGPTPWLWMEKK
jgi:hypothetical protein